MGLALTQLLPQDALQTYVSGPGQLRGILANK